MREMYKITRDKKDCILFKNNKKIEYFYPILNKKDRESYNKNNEMLYPSSLETFFLNSDFDTGKEILFKVYMTNLFPQKQVLLLKKKYDNKESYINICNQLIYRKDRKIVLYDLNSAIINYSNTIAMIDLMKLFERSEEIIKEKEYDFITNEKKLFANANIYSVYFPGLFRLGQIDGKKYLAFASVNEFLDYINANCYGLISSFVYEFVYSIRTLIGLTDICV